MILVCFQEEFLLTFMDALQFGKDQGIDLINNIISSVGMQERTAQSSFNLIKDYEQQLGKVIKDFQALNRLIKEIQLLPEGSFEISIAYHRICIVFFPLRVEKHEGKRPGDESRYLIKVSQAYPLSNSIHVKLLEGPFQPRLSDCRDLLSTIMGRDYSWDLSLKDIAQKIVHFDHLLHQKNQQFLYFQRLGRFLLGQSFYYHELMDTCPSLTLLKDLSQKKSFIYVGISQTHLLLFKEMHDKNAVKFCPIKHSQSLLVRSERQAQQQNESTLNRLCLISAAELNCISTIYYRQQQQTIKLTVRKYKSVKLYYEHQQIKLSYKFNRPQVFLRALLKFITKYQNCEIGLQIANSMNKKRQRSTSVVSSQKKIEEELYAFVGLSARLQTQLQSLTDEIQIKAKVGALNKVYQRLIEFYSARANPYYLIFVNKLNHVYHKYFLPAAVSPNRVT